MKDREIVEGPDGPEGYETIEFSSFGIRLALLNGEDGRLTEYGRYDLSMLGNELPDVGDTFSMLWPKGDPGCNETYEVVARYYVGEFNGDNCWWLIMKERKPTKIDLAVYKLSRHASAETRRIKRARQAQIEKSLLAAAIPKKRNPRPKGRG